MPSWKIMAWCHSFKWWNSPSLQNNVFLPNNFSIFCSGLTDKNATRYICCRAAGWPDEFWKKIVHMFPNPISDKINT
jgi:hypothetical protein